MRDDPKDPMDPVVGELRGLARELRVPPPGPELVAAVLERVAAEPVPVRPGAGRRAARWVAERWRAVVSTLVALVVAAALTPPVRAAVADWFGLGAVEVRTGAGPVPPAVPPGAGGSTLDRARDLVGFSLVVPAELGPPEGVGVSDDRQVVSMSWSAGAIRLDQVAAELSPYFAKSVHRRVVFTEVEGAQALWLPEPHTLSVVAGDGERSMPPRLAGPTLVWQHGAVTLRLEGVADRARAIAVAESVR